MPSVGLTMRASFDPPYKLRRRRVRTIHRRREIDEAPDFDPSSVLGSPRYFKLEAELRSYFSLPLASIVA